VSFCSGSTLYRYQSNVHEFGGLDKGTTYSGITGFSEIEKQA
jgi:hypothetical protein